MILHFPMISVLCVFFLKVTDAKIIRRTCYYTLHIFNDGPVTLDVPVTISAFLECTDEDDEYLYVFEDEEKRKEQVIGHQTAKAVFIFDRSPGLKTIKVGAYRDIHPFPKIFKVASGKTVVEVHEYIPGNLELSGVLTDKDGDHYATVGKDMNVSIDIYYPQRVINDAEFSYSWTVGESRFSSRHPYLVYQFKDPGPQRIRAAVVARIPSYDGNNFTRYKWGHFEAELIVKNPFKNINITGNTYLKHGQLLNLDISCSGSGPVDYCWKVLPSNENNTNLSCAHPVTAVECSFPIIYYFHDSGDFLLAIFINNFVSSNQRNIEIHIYDVSLRPQLSIVIIPMVCTILVLLMIASAVVAHVRRKTNYDIETADFDFMTTDEVGAIGTETSWENMRRSFIRLLHIPYIYYTTEVQNVNYGTVTKLR